MLIRQENPSDYEQIYELVKVSFATSSHADGTEADYINDVRKKDTFIEKLSLVAENDNGKIVGQIVLYKMTITTTSTTHTELVLSPISVQPQYFKQGIATAMMQKAFHIAKELGFNAVFLCGEPAFYRKIGFKPTYEFNIFHVKDSSAEWSMAIELNKGSLTNIIGTIDID